MSEHEQESKTKLLPHERWVLAAALVIFAISFLITALHQPKINDTLVVYPTSSDTSEASSEDTRSRISSSDLEMLLEAASKSGRQTQNNQIIGKININTATSDELQQLSGIGEVKAKAIIEYRTNYGNFTTIDELMNVKGIGEKTFEKIKDSITV